MPRDFPQRYRRVVAGPFAGDPAPAGVLPVNDPVTGLGIVFRMPVVRVDYPSSPPTRRMQGFVVSNLAITVDLQLWVASDNQQDAGSVWVMVGDPFLGVALGRLWEAAGPIYDPDAVVQVTPSAALGAGDSLTVFMEAVD